MDETANATDCDQDETANPSDLQEPVLPAVQYGVVRGTWAQLCEGALDALDQAPSPMREWQDGLRRCDQALSGGDLWGARDILDALALLLQEHFAEDAGQRAAFAQRRDRILSILSWFGQRPG